MIIVLHNYKPRLYSLCCQYCIEVRVCSEEYIQLDDTEGHKTLHAAGSHLTMYYTKSVVGRGMKKREKTDFFPDLYSMNITNV
jgi:hypothetical protein